MEDELAELVALYDLDPKRFFPKSKKDGTKAERLFYLARENPKAGKDFYKEHLYGKGYRGTGYEVLRKGLIDDLYKFLGAGDLLLKDSDRIKKITAIRKKTILVLNLHSTGRGHLAFRLAKRTINEAYKYEQLHAVEVLSDAISTYYSVRSQKIKSLEFGQKAKRASKMRYLEQELARILRKWLAEFALRKTTEKWQIVELNKDLILAKGFFSQNPTMQSRLNVTRLELLLADSERDFERLVTLSSSGLKLMDENPVFPRMFRELLLGTKFYAYVNLRQCQRALDMASSVEAASSVGSFNWFVFKEQQFILLIVVRDWVGAQATLKQCLDHGPGLPKIKVQIWNLYEAYIKFIQDCGLIEKPLVRNDKDTQFRYARFFNESENIEKDHKGYHASIIILKFLLSLNLNKYHDSIDLRDSLVSFSRRYLTDGPNQRTRIFMTFLVKVVDCDFIHSEVMKSTGKLREKMGSFQPNFNSNLGGNEIIDYEVLWDWVLNKIKENSYTRPLN